MCLLSGVQHSDPYKSTDKTHKISKPSWWSKPGSYPGIPLSSEHQMPWMPGLSASLPHYQSCQSRLRVNLGSTQLDLLNTNLVSRGTLPQLQSFHLPLGQGPINLLSQPACDHVLSLGVVHCQAKAGAQKLELTDWPTPHCF